MNKNEIYEQSIFEWLHRNMQMNRASVLLRPYVKRKIINIYNFNETMKKKNLR